MRSRHETPEGVDIPLNEWAIAIRTVRYCLPWPAELKQIFAFNTIK